MEPKIQEITEETKQEQNKQKQTLNNSFALSVENCLAYLVNLVSTKCNAALSLKDAEMVNRGVRFLSGREQILPSLNNTINEKIAYNLIFNCINIGHSKGLLNIEEDSIVYYCIDFLTTYLNNKEQK